MHVRERGERERQREREDTLIQLSISAKYIYHIPKPPPSIIYDGTVHCEGIGLSFHRASIWARVSSLRYSSEL